MTRPLGLLVVLIILFSLTSCLLPYAFTLSKSDGVRPEGPHEDSSFENIDEVWIHYRLVLPQTSDIKGKLLMVHGLGGSTYTFNPAMEALVDAGFAVVAVDLPGFGYSGRPEKFDHSQEHRAQILWTLLDMIDRESDMPMMKKLGWHLVGHSMGGGTVAAMAVARPAETASLVLVSGALEISRGISSLVLAFPPFARWTRLYLERSLLTDKKAGGLLSEAYGREADEHELSVYLEPLQLPGTARTLTSMVRTTRSIPLDTLKSLHMPVAAIWGDSDTVVPIEKSRAIGIRIPQLRLYIIEGAAHIPMETHVEQFNAALFEFLEDYVR